MKYNCYDDLAKKYDDLVEADIEKIRFPYSEHGLVHDLIAEYVSEAPKNDKIKVLDIGIGTGSLYEKIIPESIELTGIDNCEPMLEIAKLRCPEAKLINHNLKKGLPQEIIEEKYDFIVVTYFLMHFDVEFVLYFIELFRKHLAPFGKLLIGDIMFYNQSKLSSFLQTNPKKDDSLINFHVYEDMLERIDDNFELSYMEINNYTGLIIVEKLYENSLQYEDTLVKYKSNTMKWKSSHPEKKSE